MNLSWFLNMASEHLCNIKRCVQSFETNPGAAQIWGGFITEQNRAQQKELQNPAPIHEIPMGGFRK